VTEQRRLSTRNDAARVAFVEPHADAAARQEEDAKAVAASRVAPDEAERHV
jgi:hypothetical protein